jgi:23S rRNA (adenine1618-N6)-methyltransferase
MSEPIKPTAEKGKLHPRNPHGGRYNFEQLIAASPRLKNFVHRNKHDVETIDFSNPEAVLSLNEALLRQYYGLSWWQIPESYLVPPVPGRADYIHYLADLLASDAQGHVPKGNGLTIMDIGTGANLIYPIVGISTYQWSFLCTDSDAVALKSAKQIVEKNTQLAPIEFRKQTDKELVFLNVLGKGDIIDAVMCNPPFHESMEEAAEGTHRKWRNLKAPKKDVLNFGGNEHELSYPGGESGFIAKMIEESKAYSKQVLWFTCLISKEESLRPVYKQLKKASPMEIRKIEMTQGQKQSRFVAWTYHTAEMRGAWAKARWGS